MTVASLGFAYRDSGVRRTTGALIIGAYLVFLGSLLATAHSAFPDPRLTAIPLAVAAGGARAGPAPRAPGNRRPGGTPPGSTGGPPRDQPAHARAASRRTPGPSP